MLGRDILSHSVVVFSKNYLPMSRINIKRAIALIVTGKAEPLDFGNGNGWVVRSPSCAIYVPEYIRLIFGQNERVWNIPPVNRREVFRRDGHVCQYCGNGKHLTLDHVIPRSKGGSHSWNNIVTACEKCNSRKGDRTPTEAGMILRAKPKAPLHPTIAFAESFWGAGGTGDWGMGNRE